MLKKTVTFALKSFRKTAFMNSLNVLSLTLGLSVFFLIALFLYQEKSYEKDFDRRNDIVQVGTQLYNKTNRVAWTSINLQHVFNEISGIEKFTQFDSRRASRIKVDSDEHTGIKLLLADSSFFDVFKYRVLAGNPEQLLDNSGMAVIREDLALRIFGTTDVMGEMIHRGEKSYIINGVVAVPHFKTQLDYELFITKDYSESLDGSQWQSVGSYTYLLTHPETSIESINEQLVSLGKKYIYPVWAKTNPDFPPFEEWREQSSYLGLYAEPLMNLRVTSDTKNLLMPQINLSQFNTLIIVGLAALVISMINFINISTAKSSVRTREVAVKRILGSSRNWLIAQFMMESFMQIALAALLALGIVESIVNMSPGFLEGMLGYSVTHSTEWVVGIVLFTLFLTLLSGIYPALYLSSGRILGLLRGGRADKEFSVFNAAFLRKVATVVQFVLSVVLIAGVITMFQQIDHLRGRDLGFESSNVFIIDNTWKLKETTESFRQELLRQPFVQSASYSDHFPNQADLTVLSLPLKTEEGAEVSFISYRTDPSFFETMQMEFVMGESFEFSKKKQGEESNEVREYPVVINETAARALGYNDPIGKKLSGSWKIVGVVNDFVFSDLRQEISPVVIGPRNNRPYYKLAVRMAPGNYDIERINEVWSEFNNEKMAWYEFSSNYDRLLKEENKTFSAVLTFSIFTVIISCLGLLGLAVFTIDQRIREFGIRKVLGASIADVVKLFSWDFVKLILIAFVIGFPIIIYGLNIWLSDFSDRISLGPSVFVFTGLITLLVVFSTLALQSFKAGRLNPVDTLRDE